MSFSQWSELFLDWPMELLVAFFSSLCIDMQARQRCENITERFALFSCRFMVFCFKANALTIIATLAELRCNVAPNVCMSVAVSIKLLDADSVFSYLLMLLWIDALLSALIYRFVITRRTVYVTNCHTIDGRLIHSTKTPGYQHLLQLPFSLIGQTRVVHLVKWLILYLFTV